MRFVEAFADFEAGALRFLLAAVFVEVRFVEAFAGFEAGALRFLLGAIFVLAAFSDGLLAGDWKGFSPRTDRLLFVMALCCSYFSSSSCTSRRCSALAKSCTASRAVYMGT